MVAFMCVSGISAIFHIMVGRTSEMRDHDEMTTRVQQDLRSLRQRNAEHQALRERLLKSGRWWPPEEMPDLALDFARDVQMAVDEVRARTHDSSLTATVRPCAAPATRTLCVSPDYPS